MSETASNCSCYNLTRLEGAAVQAYITKFLQKENKEFDTYNCRKCGVHWQRIEEAKRPSLIKIGK